MFAGACVASVPRGGASVTERPPSTPASSYVSASPEGSAVPWLAATPAPSPVPTATGSPSGPECVAGQLAATPYAGDASSSPGFTIWNAGPAPCQIGRAVRVVLVDSLGRTLNITQETTPLGPMCGGTGPQCPPPGPTTPPWIFMPPSGDGASNGGEGGSLRWTNWCNAKPAEPLALEITLGSGVVVDTTGMEVAPPACTDAGKPSILDVTPIEIGGSWPPEPSAIPASDLQARLETPASTSAGGTLHYVVALRNPTSAPIPLLPCPTFQEALISRGGTAVEEHVLNCASVRSIPPGASVRFEMELVVPTAMASSGTVGLVWQLDPWYSLGLPPVGPAAKVAITVVAP